jgi:hypothetical protein
MGQRVRIQYSVELSQLQKEVNRLYKTILEESNYLIRCKDSPEIKLDTHGLEKIHSLRESLARMDIMLDDLQQIIEGYIHYKVPPRHQENPQDLSGQITKFKELISENTD